MSPRVEVDILPVDLPSCSEEHTTRREMYAARVHSDADLKPEDGGTVLRSNEFDELGKKTQAKPYKLDNARKERNVGGTVLRSKAFDELRKKAQAKPNYRLDTLRKERKVRLLVRRRTLPLMSFTIISIAFLLYFINCLHKLTIMENVTNKKNSRNCSDLGLQHCYLVNESHGLCHHVDLGVQPCYIVNVSHAMCYYVDLGPHSDDLANESQIAFIFVLICGNKLACYSVDEIGDFCLYLNSITFHNILGNDTQSEDVRVNMDGQINNGYYGLAAMTSTCEYDTRRMSSERQPNNGHNGQPASWIVIMDGYRNQSLTSAEIRDQTFSLVPCCCQNHMNPTCDCYLASILYRAGVLFHLFALLNQNVLLFLLKSAKVKQYIETMKYRCVLVITSYGWGFSVIGTITLCVYVYRRVRYFLCNRYKTLKCVYRKLSKVGHSQKCVHYDSQETQYSVKSTSKRYSVSNESTLMQIHQDESKIVNEHRLLPIGSIKSDFTPLSFHKCFSNAKHQRKHIGYCPHVHSCHTHTSIRSEDKEIDSSPRNRNSNIPSEKKDLYSDQRSGSTKETVAIGDEQPNDSDEEAENASDKNESVNDQKQVVKETQVLHYETSNSEIEKAELAAEPTIPEVSEQIEDEMNPEAEACIDQRTKLEDEDVIVDEKTNSNTVEHTSQVPIYLVCNFNKDDDHSPQTEEVSMLHEGPLMGEIHPQRIEMTCETSIDCHGNDQSLAHTGKEDDQVLGLVIRQLGITNNMHSSQISDSERNMKLKTCVMIDTTNESHSSCNKPENSPSIDGIVDLKEKAEERDQQTDFKKASQGKTTEKSKEDYVETLRDLTWLSPDQLPVHIVNIVVAVLFEPLGEVLKNLAVGENMPGPQITMRYELLRLCTLRNYPRVDKPHIIRLAQAGFYYAAEGDEVICFVCGLRKRCWHETDVPMEIHKRVSPNCGFFSRNSEYNVPVPRGPEPERNTFGFLNDLYSEAERTSAGTSGPMVSSRTVGPNQENTEDAVSVSGATAAAVTEVSSTSTAVRAQVPAGARISGMPKFPQYAVRSMRQASYEGWPDNTGQEIEELSDAGLYYAGIGDCTRCFFCGIGLRHWSDDDNVWIEHARWSRNCGYLIQVKGEEFINLVHMAIEYTENADEQPGASGGNDGNVPPSDEIDRLLRSDAAQSVLEMGYQPRVLKRALEMVLREHGASNIRAVMIMEKINEMEEMEEATRRVADLNIDKTTSAANNQPQCRNTDKFTSVRHESRSEQNIESRDRQQSSQDTNAPETTPTSPTSEPNSSASAFAEGRSSSGQISSQLVNSSQVSNTDLLGRKFGDSVQTNAASGSPAASTAAPPSKPVQLGSRSLDSATGTQQTTTTPSQGRRRHNSDNRTKKQDKDLGHMQKHLFAGQDTKLIRKENEELREQTRCKVCMDKTVCIVFLPCGHLVTCEECAPAMRKCPVCRVLVKGTVKAFMG